MKLSTIKPRKNTAQAMVEFAIVLPLLLLLLYGLLEAGRLLFIYSTIVTASRQAARYGSATGDGINPGVPRYQDCAGMRVAANRVDFLNAFDEYDVIIQHDTGPGSTPIFYCTNVTNNVPDPSLPLDPSDPSYTPTSNSDRLVVTILGDFNPIIPRIVPFIARTRTGGNPVRAISARTILTGVAIEVTPPPGPGPGPSPTGLTLTITASPPTYNAVGQIITFTYTLTNDTSPGVDVTGPFTITDSFGSITCPDLVLIPGASATCPPVTYQIIQSDFDTARTIIDIATASNGTLSSNEATISVPLDVPPVTPAITLSKTVSTTLATVGDTVTYTFTLTNSGNVPLTGSSLSDPQLGGVIAGCGGDLPVGGAVTCTVPYTVNSAHIVNGQIINTATATAAFGTQPVNATASSTLDIYTGSLFLSASASPGSVSQVGQVITYSYSFKNLTANTLYLQAAAPLPLSGQRGDNCPAGAISPNGGIATCTVNYTVTQADLDAGTVLANTITATACTEVAQCNGNRRVDSNSVSLNVAVLATPSLSLQATASPTAPTPPATIMTVGAQITYTYTLTNTGNVTLSSPFTITDPAVSSVTCSATSLAPGGTMTCTGTHTITDADLDAGVITTQATASGVYAATSQTVSAIAAPITIVTYQGPRLRLQITANPTTYPQTGQMIIYTYTLINTGTVPLSGPYLVKDPDGNVNFIDCATAISPLKSGASTTCTGSANTSGAPGSTITIRATANASDGTRTITSNMATVTLTNPILACNSVTAVAGSLQISGTTMSMSISNPINVALKIKDVTLSWNNTFGHQTGNDKTLKLLNAKLGSTTFWTASGTGNPGPQATLVPTTAVSLAAGTSNPTISTLTFTFHQSYDNWANPPTEFVTVTLDMAGCESVVITIQRP